MATSEPLVPTGMPQGTRAATRKGMITAGIPLAPQGSQRAGQARGAPVPSQRQTGGRPPSGASLDLSKLSPADFPFLSDNPAAAGVPDPSTSVIGALSATTMSEFGRAVLARIASG